MMAAALDETGLRGELLLDEPLARHTSWRVGGPARRFYRPADRADLVAFLRTLAPDEPLLWLGLGSNLLVRDGGFRGTVLAVSGRLNALRLNGPGRLYGEAGVACAHVARLTVRNGGVGLEFLAGIPGTLGGALAMNAGAFGGEMPRARSSACVSCSIAARRPSRPASRAAARRSATRPATSRRG